MNGILRKKQLWIPIILIVAIAIWIWWSNRKVDGSKGGILEGPSHENGGIDAIIKGGKAKIELEGNEAIINKKSMEMNQNIICEGTPRGIASAVNEFGGGVGFDKNGICRIK